MPWCLYTTRSDQILLPAALTILLASLVVIMPLLALADTVDSFDALSGARDIATATILDSTYALTASLTGDAIQIIDISDPANPFPVAAIFDGQGGFVLTDVADMAIVAVEGKTYVLAVNLGDNSIQVIDITDPADPLPVTVLVDGQNGFGLGGPTGISILTTPDKTYALVANLLSDSIQIIDFTDPANPLPVASVFDEQDGFDALTAVDSIGVVTISERAYALVVSTLDDAIQIIDVTDPANPLPVTSLHDGQDGFDFSNPTSIAVLTTSDREYALVANLFGNSIQIIDITNPTNSLSVTVLVDGQGGFDALGGAYGIALANIGENAYALVAASDDGGVQIIDITNPSTPLPVASIFYDERDFGIVDETAEVDTSVMAQVRFDTASIEARVHALVTETALLYLSGGEAMFDDITPSKSVPTHGLYPFILNAETFEVEADGANPALVGTIPDTFMRADKSLDQIRENLHRNGAMWLSHMQVNSDTGTDQLKHSLLYLYDGYVFGAGYLVHDSEVQAVVDEAIRQYEASGTAAFDEIASGKFTDGLYPFVLDAATAQPVAYGTTLTSADSISDTFLSGAAKPYSQIKAELNRDGHAWVSYVITNPDANTQQLKRTWLQLHDGYIFASGYHLPDSRVQSLVESAVLLYQSNGEGAFDIITPNRPAYTDALYPFVLNSTTLATVAHGAFPDKLGAVPVTSLLQGDRPWPQIEEELRMDGSAWASYVFTNPDTRTDQLKRAYLQLHDGYIFASGYYLPDSRVQSEVDKVISTYRSVGTEAFDILNSGADSIDDPYFAFVVNKDGTLVANGAPILGTGKAHGLPVERDRSPIAIYGDLVRDGHVWVEDISVHPITLTSQILRSWLYQYDDYIFGSGYYHADSEVQSQVDRAIFMYRTHGQAAFDMITPDHPRDDEAALYPFVFTASNYTTVAHGAIPDRVGHIPYSILDTADRPIESIMADLQRDGGTWVEYTFTNPDTGTKQLKRSWLYQYDGFVFASGYYIQDAQVQALARNAAHVYNANPTNAFALIDAVADEEDTVQLYPFVIDLETLEIRAQGIDPKWAGTDLAALTGADRATDEILAALEGTSGTWSEYDAVNPLTGETEPKRSWLTTHDGLIFGVGYYKP